MIGNPRAHKPVPAQSNWQRRRMPMAVEGTHFGRTGKIFTWFNRFTLQPAVFEAQALSFMFGLSFY